MAKTSAGFHTPRPSSLRPAAAARSSTGPSSSDPNLPAHTSIPRGDLSSNAKVTSNLSSVGSSSSASAPTSIPTPRDLSIKALAKQLTFDDDFIFPTGASDLPTELVREGLAAPEDNLVPLLELPDPDAAGDANSSAVVSASVDDAMTASADSAITEVTAPADSEDRLPEHMELVLAELRGDCGLSPRSKRIVAALVEVATAELNPTATARRLRRADFWGKVRIGILAVTIFSVAAIDLALAVALIGRRGNGHYDVLPPT